MALTLNFCIPKESDAIAFKFMLPGPDCRLKQKKKKTFSPAGDVTRVSVMPRKVTVKIGDVENRCRS